MRLRLWASYRESALPVVRQVAPTTGNVRARGTYAPKGVVRTLDRRTWLYAFSGLRERCCHRRVARARADSAVPFEDPLRDAFAPALGDMRARTQRVRLVRHVPRLHGSATVSRWTRRRSFQA